MLTAIIIGVIIIGFIFWRNRPIKNSHKLPQFVEIKEYGNPNNNPDQQIWQKGYKLTLSREMGNPGYNLFVTINTNGKDLTNLKKIIISSLKPILPELSVLSPFHIRAISRVPLLYFSISL